MTNNLRVYITIFSFHPLVGGAEMQAMSQARILRKRGYESTIITFRHKRAWPRTEELEGIPVIRLAGGLLDGREKSPRVIQQLRYLFALFIMGWTLWRDRNKYDILHVYQLSALTLPAALACFFTRKPMLIAVRSTGSGAKKGSRTSASLIAGPLDPNTEWLHVDGITWVNGDLEGLINLGKPALSYARTLLRRIGARIIILSTRMKSYLATYDFLLPDMQLIPNGVDMVRFQPGEDDVISAERSQVVVCVAKLRYEKGIDVLLQAWHLVHKQQPEARLILVGSGSLQDRLVRMAEELGITECVEFAGLQTDVPAQIRRGGIAVLPSRWEGMPNAILEAMACGLPCVATRVSGSEDIIQHGVNGLLVDIEDYKEMSQALLALLRDPVLAQNYGQVARTTIEKHYSLEHITDAYIELYQSMMGLKKQVAEKSSTL